VNVSACKRNALWVAVFLALQLAGLIGLAGLAPAAHAGQSAPWKFAVLCDTRGDSNPANPYKSGLNDAVVSAAAQDIVREGAELVLVPGDLVNGHSYILTPFADQFAAWRKAMAPVYEAGIKVYPIRGNHEDGPFPKHKRYPWPPSADNPPVLRNDELRAAFLAAFDDPWIPVNGPAGEQRLTYSFSHKNAFFVGLDHFVNPIKVNQPWLDGQLAANKLPHVFVYGHDPAFRVSHTDSLASYPAERDAFWDSLGRAGARIYFCGHDHLYNRAHVNDRAGNTIYQVLTGAGGAPFTKWHPQEYAEGPKVVNDYHDQTHYGYILVTVDGPKVTMEWKALLSQDGRNEWQTMDILEYTVQNN
jgi:hypothetical protein